MNFEQVTPWESSKRSSTPCSGPKDWQKYPAGLYEFYKDPEKNPMPTPTGKLEFWSESLEKAFPTDEERPGIPKWIEKGITHDERISSSRPRLPAAGRSNHGRWRTHARPTTSLGARKQ
jgi:trimethylamine-N-oxide reductase (cytochrome c)